MTFIYIEIYIIYMTFVYIYIYIYIYIHRKGQRIPKSLKNKSYLINIQQKSRNTTIRCNYNLSMYVL